MRNGLLRRKYRDDREKQCGGPENGNNKRLHFFTPSGEQPGAPEDWVNVAVLESELWVEPTQIICSFPGDKLHVPPCDELSGVEMVAESFIWADGAVRV